MQRQHQQTLWTWFEQKNHKPLVLRGARQVGKSTLVRLFCQNHQLELAELNFERNPEYAELFASNDPQNIVTNLRLVLNKSIRSGTSVLFLDEIQATPKVLATLRYFYEEMPHLHVIAAGSLLDFALSSASFSMPVGRISYLHLQPFNFLEFLLAVGDKALAEYLQTWNIGDGISDVVHQKLMERLRQCWAVGGMPDAIQTFINTADYRQCEMVKQDLLATFADDFSKYATHQEQALIRQAFRKAPTLIGRKVKYSDINRDIPAVKVSQSMDLLGMAKIIHKVIRTAANGVPLSAEENTRFFKLLFLDIGLVSSMFNVHAQALNDDLMLINQGALAEQWVGQELLSSLPSYQMPYIHYWAREARSSSAEIDFIIEHQRPIPIEVKAGKSGSLKSLHLFIKEKSSSMAVRLNTDKPSLLHGNNILDDGQQQDYQLLSLPLYLAGQVRRLTESSSSSALL